MSKAPGATDETRVDVGIQSAARSTSTRAAACGSHIGGRYLVLEAIGRGGMAAVYRVNDLVLGREVAMKQLVLDASHRHYATSAALFEREFHTLAELSHPRVIEVYDYGIDEHAPFYTMELLDGGDLRARSPLPWKEACGLIYDVCSSLALIHSRRLVHRDVSPGNVRCTHDGRAKLIDFGAMVPMGQGGVAVGTPQFVAPEVVHGSNLDARTDLFSLGATLYAALTGRSPYRAKNFAALTAAWDRKPAAPSQFAADVPEALDALVLAMIALEPAMRPRSAFEVMQRLAAIAGIERQEPISVSRAYLATPVMVGRDEPLAAIKRVMLPAFDGQGRSVLISGAAGVGRSRMLDACALAAKPLGAIVLRASGTIGSGNFSVATALAEQLMANIQAAALLHARKEGAFKLLFETEDEPGSTALPETLRPVRLKDFAAVPSERAEIQTALTGWFLALGHKRRIAIAVDDFHRVDEPSAAFLAGLANRIDHRRLFIVATAETDAEPVDRFAFDVFAARSTRIALAPLAREDTERLFESVFGDVQNVAIVSNGIHAIANGNPRESLDLAQHLVDSGRVRYELGDWTLPTQLAANDLPSNAEEAMRARIAALTPLARFLVEAQALATHQSFKREDYARLRPNVTPTQLDRAISELVSQQIVISDGQIYAPAHRSWCAVLDAGLSAEERAERHRALVLVHESRSLLGLVRHALLAGLETRALDALAPLLSTPPEASKFYETTDLGPSEIAATFERALLAAERIGRNGREVNELRRWVASLSVISDDAYYRRATPAWLERLKHDSGYSLWEQESAIADPQARIGRAMQLAFERYAATPEAERVYRPDEAIQGLAHYVGISLAIGSSRQDNSINSSLAPLLEPFASLTPLVHAIWQNSLASMDASSNGRPERAVERWKSVYKQLTEHEAGQEHFVGVFRRAVAHALGSSEASMGMASAVTWAQVLDDDPVQRVNGLYLRRVLRLQQGDVEGAERFRRRAEMMSLQSRTRQMFNTLTLVELVACWMAGDLTGLKQVSQRIGAQAARAPGWAPAVALAEGCFHLLCNSYEAALASFELGLTLVYPGREPPKFIPSTFCALVAGRIEALLGLERPADALATGETVLELCRAREVGVAAHGISRAVALAEAKLGHHASAATRLEAVIANQVKLGISGLHLGASYEARARVAIAAADPAAIETYARLTAGEYRHGRNSPLGARYEKLMREASRVGKIDLPNLADIDRSLASKLTQVTRVTGSGPSETESVDSTDSPTVFEK